jgi:transcriptional regulator of acetoin/glycerol metabolism
MVKGDNRPAEAGVGFDMTWLDEPYHTARDQVTAAFERQYLTWVVNRANGNMSKAARIAGIDRTTIYRLMEKHGLHRNALIDSGGRVES